MWSKGLTLTIISPDIPVLKNKCVNPDQFASEAHIFFTYIVKHTYNLNSAKLLGKNGGGRSVDIKIPVQHDNIF